MLVKAKAQTFVLIDPQSHIRRLWISFRVEEGSSEVVVKLHCPSNPKAERSARLPLEDARGYWRSLRDQGYSQW